MTFQEKAGYKKNFKQDLYEPLREQQESWIVDEQSLDQIEDFGFEKLEQESTDLFEYKSFELPNFPRNELIKCFSVAQEMFLIITKSNKIFRWRPNYEDNCVEMELPDSGSEGFGSKLFSVGSALIQAVKKPFQDDKDKKENLIIERVFIDAKGYHSILSTDGGDNYYINFKDNKVRYLQGVRGRIIKAVAWNENCTEEATKDILIATKDSKIWLFRCEFKKDQLEEWEAKQMVSIPNERQINQLEYFTLTLDQNRFACVIAATNFSIFFFYGVNELEVVFNKYKDAASVMRAESPPLRSHTSLMSTFYTKVENSRPHSFLFTNGKTLNLYRLPQSHQSLNEAFLNQYKYLRYAKKQDADEKNAYEVREMPTAVGLSEFHYFLLHSDGLTIVSRITEKVVQYYDMRQMGHILGMQYERSGQGFWVYSDRGVCKVIIQNEDKDAWKLLMEKKEYIDAYDIGRKYQSSFTSYIAGLCGDKLFMEKRYVEAAQYYLNSSKSFEEIFLMFISNNDPSARIGLESYLKHLLPKLGQSQQKVIVLSWLVELYIYRLNQQERLLNEKKQYESELARQKDLKEKQNSLKELNLEIENFLKQYNKDLDEETVYQIMQSHGRLKLCVEYAVQNNNYEMVILHHINEENYKEAIKNLKNVKDKNSMEVIQKYSYILMKYEPDQTLQLLITHIKKFDPTKIIGGLMNIPEDKRKFGIQFLEHSISKLNCTDKSIHNILLFFLTQPPNKNKLQEYLQDQETMLAEKEKVAFDLDFALRIFKGANLVEPQITIYGMMGLYAESVALALQHDFLEKAKEYAKKPEDEDKKKKLWMMIATHLLQKNDDNIEKVIDLTKQTDLIKIEDLLPHFNENIKIEHFKDEICNSLKTYNEEIEKLKEEMKKFSINSEQLKNELKMIKNKFLIIDTQQKCEHCFKHLFNDAFYLFPCNHGFHKECLVERIKQLPLDPIKIGEIDQLNNIMMQIISKTNQQYQKKNQQSKNQQMQQQIGTTFFTLMNIFSGTRQEAKQQAILSLEDEQLLKKTKEKFDQLVASECVFCGPTIVDSIQLGFELNAQEKDSWGI